MARLFVHFGMHKTGSSSIQDSLFKNLADPNFRYVHFGYPNSSGVVVTAFSDTAASYHGNQGRSEAEVNVLRGKHRDALTAQLAEPGDKVLSAEDFCILSQVGLQDFYDFVGATHERIAVGYVRRPKAFMESAFQQRLQGNTPIAQQPLGVGLYPIYRSRLAQFDPVFGEDKVQLWLFDRGHLKNGCVVQDFCSRVGADFSPEGVVNVNEGLSLNAVRLLFAYRKFGPGFGEGRAALRENAQLIDALSHLKGPKLKLHSSLVGPILQQPGLRTDLTWIEQRLGESLVEDLTADDDGAIATEQDLYAFSRESLEWLAQQLGPEFEAKLRAQVSPQQVANWVHRLRNQLVAARTS